MEFARSADERPGMIVVLNGPLGIGKFTLAEALFESIASCVMSDRDCVVAANPPAADEADHLHSTLAVLVAHHRRFGYRHFAVNQIWSSPAGLDDLRRRLLEVDVEADIRCSLLTLPLEENLRRIRRRHSARGLDEEEFERRTVVEERDVLSRFADRDLGEPIDVSAPPEELLRELRLRLGLR